MVTLNWFINKYVYIKLCFHRSYSHFNMPFQIVNVLMLVSIWMKVFTEEANLGLIAGIGVFLVIVVVVVGHLDFKLRIIDKEQDIMNQHSPQIQALLKQTGGKEK